MSAPQVPRPRRRLTQAEFDAELDRAKGVQADDHERYIVRNSKPAGDWRDEAKAELRRIQREEVDALRTRTGRRRSWWQRGWKR